MMVVVLYCNAVLSPRCGHNDRSGPALYYCPEPQMWTHFTLLAPVRKGILLFPFPDNESKAWKGDETYCKLQLLKGI